LFIGIKRSCAGSEAVTVICDATPEIQIPSGCYSGRVPQSARIQSYQPYEPLNSVVIVQI